MRCGGAKDALPSRPNAHILYTHAKLAPSKYTHTPTGPTPGRGGGCHRPLPHRRAANTAAAAASSRSSSCSSSRRRHQWQQQWQQQRGGDEHWGNAGAAVDIEAEADGGWSNAITNASQGPATVLWEMWGRGQEGGGLTRACGVCGAGLGQRGGLGLRACAICF